MSKRRTAWVAWVGIFILYFARSVPNLRAELALGMHPSAPEVARFVLALAVPFAFKPNLRRLLWILLTLGTLAVLATGTAPRLDLTVLILIALAFEHRWIPPRRTAPQGEVIVFFDGVCGLCNRFVDLLMRADRDGHLRFAPLQGPTAATRLQLHEPVENPDTVVLLEGDRRSERSEAAIRALSYLGGLWRLTEALLIVPRGIRDWVYDRVASNRYAWFGKHDICRIPTPAERSRFLD